MKFGRLGGGGSDYAAFVQHIGVPAADFSFGGGKLLKPSFEYHSHFGLYVVVIPIVYKNQLKFNEDNGILFKGQMMTQIHDLTT